MGCFLSGKYDELYQKYLTLLEENACLLADRRLIFTGLTQNKERGYALHQAGFGFPQSFFWDGENTPFALKMTKLVMKYFNRKVTQEAFGGKNTKAYRYIPVQKSLTPGLGGPHGQGLGRENQAQLQLLRLCLLECRYDPEKKDPER